MLRRIKLGEPLAADESRRGGAEAVIFAGRHHRHEAWLVPCSTLVPVVCYLGFWHNASPSVLLNITLTVFMGISMALMSTYFAVEHCMQPVIRHLIQHGVFMDYRALPAGNLRFRLGVCSTLTIMTTALMIGTLARQRAVDIIEDPDHRDEAVVSLRTHSTYITVAAVITGICYAGLMAGSITKRIDSLVAAMQQVESGTLTERLQPTGNDEIDILARQFNSMVERVDQDNRTIRDLNVHLEERVKDRTKQLEEFVAALSETQAQLTEYNSQLETARVEAESANQAKSDFLANISHELRTPLNGVLGMTDLLLTTPLNAQQRRYVQTTKCSGTALLDLLNEVLDFSKIEAGMLDTEQISFDLYETIEPIIELVSHRCREKSLQTASFVDHAIPPRLIGDPVRLRQILSNLMNNAVKFTKEGRVSVCVSLENRLDQTAVLHFRVEDTGIGIPESRFDRLFQPFSQVDASTTRKYGGTGLGLAICKKLCELMGGRIGVESEFGRGSTFWFSLPFGVADPNSESCWSKLAELRGLRVLVVDASESSRDTLKDQLAGWGLHAHAVNNGTDALRSLHEAAVRQLPYAVVFWDSAVSDVSAEELATTVTSTPELSNTVLILLTVLGGPEDTFQLPSPAFFDCLTKPVMCSALFNAIIEAVTTDRAAQTRHRFKNKDASQADVIPRTMRHGVRILLAEDNDINQEVAIELLTHAGYHCDVANDGRQAVEMLAAAVYDLVLMDCQMPEMDGLEATRLIRELERAAMQPGTRPLPIIALTANALKGEQERCLSAGMTDYLSKPFNPIKLIETIEAHLGQLDHDNPVISPPIVDQTFDASSPNPTVERKQIDAFDSVVDVASLLKRCLGKSELARKLLTKFHARLPDDLTQISSAIKAGDPNRLASLAHTLKGTSGNLSAQQLHLASGELESHARNGDLDAARVGLELLEREAARFLERVPALVVDMSDQQRRVIDVG
ncbi:MAG: ATP-binding protein [Planctomycetaceae bacterium]